MYDASAYASGLLKTNTAQGPKWNQPSQIGNKKVAGNLFNNKRRMHTPSQQGQVYYCEVCKISCAGPQVFYLTIKLNI